MRASPNNPTLPRNPNPDTTAPTNINRLLLLLNLLVSFGKDFAATLRQQTVTPHLRLTLQVRFGTADLARILARLGHALRLAAALQARLRRQAATGQDVRTNAELALLPSRSRGNRSAGSASRHATAESDSGWSEDGLLPSEAEIAAMVRRGRIGPVIEAICRNLGLVPGIVGEPQWNEVADVIIAFGGNFARMIGDVFIRMQACIADAALTGPLTDAAIEALHQAIFAGADPPD